MKKSKDEIIYNKFVKKYSVIFEDKKFIDFTKNHFNSNGSFAAFILALVENQIGDSKLLGHLKINKDEWIDLFFDIYHNKQIQKAYEELSLNPVILYESVLEYFDSFEVLIDGIWNYFETEMFDIKIQPFFFKSIIKKAFGYILYNDIECKMFYKFDDILADPEYDQKVTMITYNTKLFADVKQLIVNNCGNKINDLITLLLGLSKDLYLKK